MFVEFSGVVFDLHPKGYGLVKHPQGKIFGVKGVWFLEEGRFSIHANDLNHTREAFAACLQISKPSPSRVQSDCTYFGFNTNECQGCAWMMVSLEAQASQKIQRLKNTFLAQNIVLKDKILQPLISSPKNLGYRNRAQFKTNGQVLGFATGEGHGIVPIKKCLVLNSKMQSHLKKLQKKMPYLSWAPKPPHKWTSIECDDEMNFEDISPNLKCEFKQANEDQNQRMKQWLGEALKNEIKESTVIELFCGSGNFTEVLSEAGFKNVVAVESSERALFKLKQKNLPAVKALICDLYNPKDLHKIKNYIQKAELLVLDPPREGLKLKEKLMPLLPSLKSIYYVSCDPESLAKDCAYLIKERNFVVSEVTPIDLFPQTPHLEVLVKLEISR